MAMMEIYTKETHGQCFTRNRQDYRNKEAQRTYLRKVRDNGGIET